MRKELLCAPALHFQVTRRTSSASKPPLHVPPSLQQHQTMSACGWCHCRRTCLFPIPWVHPLKHHRTRRTCAAQFKLCASTALRVIEQNRCVVAVKSLVALHVPHRRELNTSPCESLRTFWHVLHITREHLHKKCLQGANLCENVRVCEVHCLVRGDFPLLSSFDLSPSLLVPCPPGSVHVHGKTDAAKKCAAVRNTMITPCWRGCTAKPSMMMKQAQPMRCDPDQAFAFGALRSFKVGGVSAKRTPKRRPHSDTSAKSKDICWTNFASFLIASSSDRCLSFDVKSSDALMCFMHMGTIFTACLCSSVAQAQNGQVETRLIGIGMRRQHAKPHQTRHPCGTASYLARGLRVEHLSLVET